MHECQGTRRKHYWLILALLVLLSVTLSDRSTNNTCLETASDEIDTLIAFLDSYSENGALNWVSTEQHQDIPEPDAWRDSLKAWVCEFNTISFVVQLHQVGVWGLEQNSIPPERENTRDSLFLNLNRVAEDYGGTVLDDSTGEQLAHLTLEEALRYKQMWERYDAIVSLAPLPAETIVAETGRKLKVSLAKYHRALQIANETG